MNRTFTVSFDSDVDLEQLERSLRIRVEPLAVQGSLRVELCGDNCSFKAGDKVIVARASDPPAVPVEPNNGEVLCPKCCHQFPAVPVSLQQSIASILFGGPRLPSHPPTHQQCSRLRR